MELVDFRGEILLEKLYTKESLTNTQGREWGYKILFNQLPKRVFDRCKQILDYHLQKGPIYGTNYESLKRGLLQYVYNELNYADAIETNLAKIVLKIIDYKYMKESDYQNYRSFVVDEKGENKIKDDIQKQLIYEWTIQQNIEETQTESEFWIPHYSEILDFDASKKVLDTPSEEFRKSQIKVCKINFNILQQHYVSLYAV